MKSLHYPFVRFRSSYPLRLLILVVSAILLGMVLLLHFWKGIPISKLTRDPTAIAFLPAYTGFLSQIGIFLWSASATICFFSATVLSKGVDCQKLRRFLVASALLTLILGLDDAFLLHEKVLPRFGIPQIVTYCSYMGFVLLYFFSF